MSIAVPHSVSIWFQVICKIVNLYPHRWEILFPSALTILDDSQTVWLNKTAHICACQKMRADLTFEICIISRTHHNHAGSSIH